VYAICVITKKYIYLRNVRMKIKNK
jgi:hypothetical protein